MASLAHPNIAAVWDYDQAGGIPFFVMAYYCLNPAIRVLRQLQKESLECEPAISAPHRRSAAWKTL